MFFKGHGLFEGTSLEKKVLQMNKGGSVAEWLGRGFKSRSDH